MAKAMSYPAVFRVLMDGGYVAAVYHTQKDAERTVHAGSGERLGHITGLQLDELIEEGILTEKHRRPPWKGAGLTVYFELPLCGTEMEGI